MSAIRAVVFDLYGTLLEIGDRVLFRELPRLLGVRKRAWMSLVTGRLLTTGYPDRHALARALVESLAPHRGEQAVGACEALVERELASVRLVPGVRSLLAFLARRGLRLAVASNLSSVHLEPLRRFGLDALVDHLELSCESGRVKPDPRVYEAVASALEVEAGAVLWVGDSARSDVLGPRAAGMRALRVSGEERPAEPGRLRRATDVGWLALSGPAALTPLLAPGEQVELGGRSHLLEELTVMPDERQGRYNLVFEGSVSDQAGERVAVVAKRYLAPESAHVEALAFALQGLVGLPSCRVAVVGRCEPALVATRARGERFPEGEAVDPPLAYEIGRHTVFAYVFANADMRPRNAFVEREGDTVRMTMVDLEHCFLNLAIDTSALPDPLSPRAIDRLGGDALRGLAKRRVLTDRTLRRARRSYFRLEGTPAAVVAAYRQGVLDEYRRFKADAGAICDLVAERLYREPCLVVGTRAYRRAMAAIDLEEIRLRLAEEPERVAAVLCDPLPERRR